MAFLRSAGHDGEWVGDWSADPGDEDVLATAAAHGQVLITLERTSANWRSCIDVHMPESSGS